MAPEQRTRVGIVTSEAVPYLTTDGRALLAELRDHGLAAEPIRWSDSGVDPSRFDALVVRSCWEYHTRPDAFRNWVRSVEDAGTLLCNPAPALEWSLHKFYLRELADEGVPVLPTAWIERSSDADLRAVLREHDWREAVIKPTVGASSAGIFRTSVDDAPAHQERFDALVSDGDVLVQEFATEIDDGERSLVFFGGEFSHATRHRPAAGDFRAHPDYGGTTEPYDPPREIVDQAADALRTACSTVGVGPSDLPYARVDGIERDGTLRLMELELIEPYLSLEAADGALEAFADAIESHLERRLPASVDLDPEPLYSTDQP